jgi:hypothetical protein
MFAFFQRFADTNDGDECVPTGGLDFLSNVFVGFAEILPPFGVADDDVAAAQLFQHWASNLAGKGPLRFPMEVLRGQVNGSSGQQAARCLQCAERRSNHNLTVYRSTEMCSERRQ